jgi:hypothetical protein
MSESLPAAAPTPDPAPEASPPGRPLVTHFLYGYKQERSIRAAIEGVLAQTYQPLEVVLSDDCSPDGTYRVMQEMAAAYRGPHKVVLNRNPKNLGIAGHVERIMEIASSSRTPATTSRRRIASSGWSRPGAAPAARRWSCIRPSSTSTPTATRSRCARSTPRSSA